MIDSGIANAGRFAYSKPTRHDWNAKRPELESLIAQDYGLYKLGKHFGMTSVGMLQVLRRLGLQTRRQRERSAALTA